MSGSPQTETSLDPRLAEWVGSVMGGAVVDATAVPGGNRRQAWLVDICSASEGRRSLFLRADLQNADDDPYTIRREAEIYRALTHTDVALPRFEAAHPTLEAMIVERVDGDTAFYRLHDVVQRRAVARSFMEELAVLHQLDVEELDLGTLGRPSTVRTHLEAELRTWEGLYYRTGRADPLVEVALGWLWRNVPSANPPVRLVHGDAGPGNFIFRGDRVVALVDWELAHLGDPMEDLAWLSMRQVFEPFPDFSERLCDYEGAGGEPVSVDRILYYRVLVELRVVVIRHRRTGAAERSGDHANSLLSRAVNRRLLVEALAEAEGLQLQPTSVPEAPETERTELYDGILTQIRDVIVPRSDDAVTIMKAKNIARVLKYLQSSDRLSPALEREELADLRLVLRRAPRSVQDGRARLAAEIRAGRVEFAAALQHLARQATRDTALMRAALGPLAERHLPSLAVGSTNDTAGRTADVQTIEGTM